MKTHAAWMLLLLCLVALPVWSDDSKADDAPPKEETILGTWYPQPKTDEFPMGEWKAPAMHFVFEVDGSYTFVINERELVGKYHHDAEQKKITMLNRDGGVISEVTYAFQGDVLLFKSKIEEKREDVAEYTRNPEGAERHQKIRKEQFHAPSREAGVKSMVQMRQIFQGRVTYANSNRDIYPTNIGLLLELKFIEPGHLLLPWGQAKVPDGFDGWKVAEQIVWANRNTGYLFLLAGEKMKLDSKRLALLELPTESAPKTVSVMFGDGQGRVITYTEADKLIKQQTGHTLDQWMKTATPGTGKMVVPKKQGEDEQ